jgi:hypothetical protein
MQSFLLCREASVTRSFYVIPSFMSKVVQSFKSLPVSSEVLTGRKGRTCILRSWIRSCLDVSLS